MDGASVHAHGHVRTPRSPSTHDAPDTRRGCIVSVWCAGAGRLRPVKSFARGHTVRESDEVCREFKRQSFDGWPEKVGEASKTTDAAVAACRTDE